MLLYATECNDNAAVAVTSTTAAVDSQWRSSNRSVVYKSKLLYHPLIKTEHYQQNDEPRVDDADDDVDDDVRRARDFGSQHATVPSAAAAAQWTRQSVWGVLQTRMSVWGALQPFSLYWMLLLVFMW